MSIDNLEHRLQQFADGNARFSEVRAALKATVSAPAADYDSISQLLEAARDNGLPGPLFAVLADQLRAAADVDRTQTLLASTSRPEAPTETGERSSATRATGASTRDAFPRDSTPDSRTHHPKASPAALGGADATAVAAEPEAALQAPPRAHDLAAADGRPARRPRPPESSAAPEPGPELGPELGPGSILRSRFELIELLGEGGMGAVWKGLDLLKVEARDRNPYVAIKLLGGDFRQHPESFIALQRETAKQQRLAHPNIATVYDFDRDEQRDVVFMTMEVLQGQSLDRYIRGLPPEGLPFDPAFAIVTQLASGLDYAHANRLVHSDLKPSNCFLSDEGHVKLLDFGIARASKTHADADGDRTLFDPAELGALTPAYATIEMFEGEDPAPSDDVYALGVIAYQLLTGSHPYGRRTAPQALAQGLEPAPVSGLSRRQNRALRDALALSRDERTASVGTFIEALRPKARARGLVLAGALALILLAIPATQWLSAYWAESEDQQTVALLEAGAENLAVGLSRLRAQGGDLRAGTPLLRERAIAALSRSLVENSAAPSTSAFREASTLFEGLNPTWREAALSSDLVRETLLAAGKQRIELAFDLELGRLDYRRAAHTLDDLERLFPGSAAVFELRRDLDTTVSRSGESARALLAALTDDTAPLPSVATATETIDNYRRINPADDMFASNAHREAAVSAAQAALDADRIDRTLVALAVAKALRTPSEQVLNLEQALEAKRAERDNALRFATLSAEIESQAPGLLTIDSFTAERERLLEFALLAPGSPLLRELRSRLQTLLEAELKAAADQRRINDGIDLLGRFAPLLNLDFVRERRDALWSASATEALASNQRHSERLSELAKVINELLRVPRLSISWEARFEPAFKQYVALSKPGDKAVGTVGDAVGRLFNDRGRDLLAHDSIDEGARMIARGLSYAPHDPLLVQARELAISALNSRHRERQIEALGRQLAGTRQQLEQALDGAVAKAALDALTNLQSIQRQLAALSGSSEVPGMPPDALLDAASRTFSLAAARASSNLNAGDLEGAAQVTGKAIDLASGTSQFHPFLPQLQREIQRQAGYRALTEAIRSDRSAALRLAPESLRSALRELALNAPGLHDSLRTELVEDRIDRLQESLASPPVDVPYFRHTVAELEAVAEDSELDEIRAEIGPGLARRIRARAAENLLGAHDLLDSAGFLASSAAVRRAARKLPPDDIARGELALSRGELNAAETQFQAARERNPRSGKIISLLRRAQKRKTTTLAQYKRYVFEVRGGLRSDPAERSDMLEAIRAAWSDNPNLLPVPYVARPHGACWSGLAGRGADTGMACYDRIDARRVGPAMVVVPAGPEVPQPFAIMQFELRADEFDAYCRASKGCAWERPADLQLPATQLTWAQAASFAKRLSQQVSAQQGKKIRYRLPTVAEWRLAAGGGPAGPARNVNCRHLSGQATSVTRGLDGKLVLANANAPGMWPALSGEPNGYGVVNAIGNVREWVTNGDTARAAGGSYADQKSDCARDISVAGDAPGEGAPNTLTGVRLVRELSADEL